MNDRILSLLGLCRRAGKLVLGADPTVDSVTSGKAKAVIYTEDFSKNSIKPVLSASHKAGVRVLCIKRSKDELSLALGKLCGVVSVEDKGFAEKLIQLIENEQGGELYDKI